MREKTLEIWVGLFIVAAAIALMVLSFRVSGLTDELISDSYHVVATFDNIGGLKVRAPVKIAGVRIGQVSDIALDPKTYRAKVILAVEKDSARLPTDTSASILTAGLLGANYVELSPGFDDTTLKENDQITSTHPALILEELIGQFLFKFNKT